MHDAAKSSERPISSPEMSADAYPGASSDRGSRSLSIAALIFVAMAAVMGWGASFVGLHEYGMQSMAGFTYWSAWLVPATFDGAAFACTLMTYRSSINGRSAVRGRILMWAFTGVSSWINWIHQPSHEAQIVAAGLPIAAVAVFDVVLLELRADYEAKHGMRGFRLRPGLLVLRWMVDRRSTSEAFRKQVIDIPVEEIAGLGTLAPPGTRRAAALKAAARAEEEQYANERANADLATAAPARQEASEDTGAANGPHGVDAEQATAASRPADRPEVTASAAQAPGTSTTRDTAPAEPETESVTRPVREKVGASAAATATSTVSARTGASTKDAADAETARTETETVATASKPEEPATAPVASKSTAKGAGAKAAKSGSGKNAETTVHGAEAATVTIELPKVSTDAKSAPAKDETAAKAESSSEPEAPAKDETAKGGTATTSTGSAKSTTTATAANSKSSGDADKSSVKTEDADTVSDSEQTLTLPPVPDGPLSDRDKRSAARADYRKSVEVDQPVKPAELGKRYGLSESWGRRQINAVRKSMAQEQAQDPADLVGAAKS